MQIFLLLIPVILSTLIWPLNHWVVKNGGRGDAYGWWISLTGALAAGGLAALLRQPFSNPALLPVGLMIGIAFSVGFCIIINYCLKIGPIGPTAAMNNLGLAGPVVVGLLWPSPQALSWLTLLGLLLAGAAIILLGLSSSRSGKQKGEDGAEVISPRWVFLVFWGWVFAALSMTGQYLGSVLASEAQFPLLCTFFSISALILLPITLRYRRAWFQSRECAGGALNGLIQTGSIFVTLQALQVYPSSVVFPVTVLGPLLAVLLLSAGLYREKLPRLAWLACAAGVTGLALLALTA